MKRRFAKRLRTTARISFVLFLGAFLGEAVYCLWPTAATRWLKENKGRFTLGFAGSHTVHFVFILALVAALGRAHLLNELGWIVSSQPASHGDHGVPRIWGDPGERELDLVWIGDRWGREYHFAAVRK